MRAERSGHGAGHTVAQPPGSIPYGTCTRAAAAAAHVLGSAAAWRSCSGRRPRGRASPAPCGRTWGTTGRVRPAVSRATVQCADRPGSPGGSLATHARYYLPAAALLCAAVRTSGAHGNYGTQGPGCVGYSGHSSELVTTPPGAVPDVAPPCNVVRRDAARCRPAAANALLQQFIRSPWWSRNSLVFSGSLAKSPAPENKG